MRASCVVGREGVRVVSDGFFFPLHVPTPPRTPPLRAVRTAARDEWQDAVVHAAAASSVVKGGEAGEFPQTVETRQEPTVGIMIAS